MKLEQLIEKHGLWLVFTKTLTTTTVISRVTSLRRETVVSWSADIQIPIFDFPVFIEKTNTEGEASTASILQKACASRKEAREKVVSLIRGGVINIRDLKGIRRIQVPDNLK